MKTVALLSPMSQLAEVLAKHGYQIIAWPDDSRARHHVDALLLSGHCPEKVICCQANQVAADMSVGVDSNGYDDLPHTIVINITGMYPEQIIAALDGRLQHHRCHH